MGGRGWRGFWQRVRNTDVAVAGLSGGRGKKEKHTGQSFEACERNQRSTMVVHLLGRTSGSHVGSVPLYRC